MIANDLNHRNCIAILLQLPLFSKRHVENRSLAGSLSRSLASIARSLDHSFARSLDQSLVRLLGRSLARSLARSTDRATDRSIARSLDRSLSSTGPVRRSMTSHTGRARFVIRGLAALTTHPHTHYIQGQTMNLEPKKHQNSQSPTSTDINHL